MFTGFPTNTVILIMAAMVATTGAAWYALSLGVKGVNASPRQKQVILWVAAILLAGLLTARLALSIFSASSESRLSSSINNGEIGIFVIAFITIGLVAGLLPLMVSSTFRRIVRAIPENWLVGIHAIRVGGYVFLALADMKLLPAGFALPAGYGDVSAGLLAVGVVFLLASKKSYARPLALAWSAFGLLDLINAEVSGIILITPYLARLSAAGVPLGYFQYVLIIPSFIVPILFISHIYFLYQLLSVPAARTRNLQIPVRELVKGE